MLPRQQCLGVLACVWALLGAGGGRDVAIGSERSGRTCLYMQ